jgi:hypothetical protein
MNPSTNKSADSRAKGWGLLALMIVMIVASIAFSVWVHDIQPFITAMTISGIALGAHAFRLIAGKRS